MKALCVCLAVAGLFLGGCSGSKPDLKEGKWKVTAEVNMKGVPFKMPPMVYEECLTQNDIIPSNNELEDGCKLTGPDIKGNTVSWRSVCTNTDGSVATSDGTITYAGETFTGSIAINISGEMPMSAQNTLTGQYIGACDQ